MQHLTARTRDPYFMHCPCCGRTWDTKGRSRSSIPARQGKSNVTGFVVSAAESHVYICNLLTPAERRERNRKDELRWLRDPPRASLIRNDPNHPGLKDAA
jgi:hypothetical protein